jgi:hypothetical protein
MKRLYGAAAFLFLGAGLLVAAGIRRAAREAHPIDDDSDEVGLASDDSFPASDPPSFTPLKGSQTGVAGGLR